MNQTDVMPQRLAASPLVRLLLSAIAPLFARQAALSQERRLALEGGPGQKVGTGIVILAVGPALASAPTLGVTGPAEVIPGAELEGQPPGASRPPADWAKSVEDALRHLDDYSYLASHPLAEIGPVQRRLPAGSRTSLDRGRAVYDLLAESIEKLRPPGEPPAELPPRIWYPYLIMRGAYVENTPNRQIMCRLYVSEGTFNRARRAAVQAIARHIQELDV